MIFGTYIFPLKNSVLNKIEYGIRNAKVKYHNPKKIPCLWRQLNWDNVIRTYDELYKIVVNFFFKPWNEGLSQNTPIISERTKYIQ